MHRSPIRPVYPVFTSFGKKGKELNRQAGWCGYFRLEYSPGMGALVRKSPGFVFHQKMPPNGGPPLNRLVEEFVTSEADFFLRTHGDIPELDRSMYRL
ncbi:MAG TPA: hypothetical protein VGH07_05925, partial [Chthoniobacterales bacterium]